MARTKRTPNSKPKADLAPIVVRVDTALANQLDRLVELQDSDRSKEIRKAIRERILRNVPNSRLAAAHA